MNAAEPHAVDPATIPPAEEMLLAQMLVMGQESLSPERYDQLEHICRDLCESRRRSLRPNSFERALALAGVYAAYLR